MFQSLLIQEIFLFNAEREEILYQKQKGKHLIVFIKIQREVKCDWERQIMTTEYSCRYTHWLLFTLNL